MRARVEQSVEYIQFFATAAAGVVVTWVVWEITEAPRAYNDANASLELVKQSNNWMQLLVDNLPIIFLFIASLGSIAWTVYKTSFT